MPDIIITPGSGLIDFYPSAKTASIFTSGNDLALSNPSGNFEIISGNLGINTTVPSGRLTVVGSGLFSTRATPLSPTGTTTGIVPNALLHLYSSTSGDTVFNVEGTNGSLFSVVDNLSGVLMSVNNNAGLPVFEVYSDDKIIGGRFNQNDFVVSSGGSIGLGTATPSGKFDVRGSIFLIGSASNRFYIHNTGAATAFTFNSIYADNSDNLTLAGGDNRIVLQGQGGRITIDAFSSEVDIGNSYNANSANQYIRFTPANTEAVRITNSGNVGIGITAPSGKLHVIGSGIFSSGIKVGDSSTNGYIYGPSGNASIQFNAAGTNRIDINSTNLFLGAATFFNGAAAYVNTTLVFPKTSTPISTATQSNPNQLRFYNGLWNGSSAYDGYNTLHSIASTSVSGASRFVVLMNNGDGTQNQTERLSVLSNGNVGINTESPTSHLHVNGSGYFASGCSVTGVLNVQAIKSPIASGTDSATITFDMNTSNLHTVTLGGNRTLAVSNVGVGQRFIIRLKQDNSPPRTVTWFSTINWPSDVVPTLTATSGAVDVFGFICTSGSTFDGFVIGYDL